MDLRRITDDFSVSPQIEANDIATIVAAGFRSLLCNRPNGEEYGQSDYEPIAEAASAAGLEVRLVPITSAGISADDLQDFRAALEEMPRPILAYCRTGTRCTMLWTIAQHGRIPPGEILTRTAEAGYDMSGLLRQLAQG